ncbi:MAG: beta-ketoacyl-ACP synthase [Hyphomicrobiaceae bacterium]|nr:beta-ketoacyl-ACP synthase [Hyphomicrobiaceae bacterium]
MRETPRDVWVTGIGLVSSLGEGVEAHAALLAPAAEPAPVLDEAAFAPYVVHPLAPIDLSKQIPKKSDQRQMEGWQRIGVYAAGLALTDAGIAGKPELLDRTGLVVAAGSGERDTSVDRTVLEKLDGREDTGLLAKEILPSALRPTLFLAQLSNLLAGNISVVHNVTGSSRTFMGEEMAGLAAAENAVRRIVAGQGELFLVGGSLNSEREDLLLGYELGRNLWRGPFRPVWARRQAGGGFVPGSVGAFLVLEARAHAEARGARPYARIAGVVSDRSNRATGEARASGLRLFQSLCGALPRAQLPVLSGASGVEPVTGEERGFLDDLRAEGFDPVVRAYGSLLGHGVEAHLATGLALAALAVSRGGFLPPSGGLDAEHRLDGSPGRVLVTSFGHWRGEGLALVEAAGGGEAR